MKVVNWEKQSTNGDTKTFCFKIQVAIVILIERIEYRFAQK
jgi:hypothetical protein